MPLPRPQPRPYGASPSPATSHPPPSLTRAAPTALLSDPWHPSLPRSLPRPPAPRSPSPLPYPAYTAPNPHIPSHRRSFAALASHLSPTLGIPSNRLAYPGSQQACSALRRPFAERRAGVMFCLMNPRTPASPCASFSTSVRLAATFVLLVTTLRCLIRCFSPTIPLRPTPPLALAGVDRGRDRDSRDRLTLGVVDQQVV